MNKSIVYLLITALLLQLGCSSITQIPYPVDESKSDNEIKSLNYFGGRLNSTIQFTNSIEVETYWFNMKEDKIFFLARGMEDTTAIEVAKISTIKFNDWYGGCLKGSWLGLGITGFAALILYISINTPSEAGYSIVIGGPVLTALTTIFGIVFLGEREFNFVQNEQ